MNHVWKIAGAGALAAGMVFAQTGSGTGQFSQRADSNAQHGWRRAGRQARAERIAKYLNLTPEQQDNAKKVFAAAKEEAAPLHQQLKQNREALMNAVKSGNEAQIDEITKSEAPVLAQLMAIRAKAFEKIYATLTPEQKTKAENMRQLFHAHRGAHAHANG